MKYMFRFQFESLHKSRFRETDFEWELSAVRRTVLYLRELIHESPQVLIENLSIELENVAWIEQRNWERKLDWYSSLLSTKPKFCIDLFLYNSYWAKVSRVICTKILVLNHAHKCPAEYINDKSVIRINLDFYRLCGLKR